MDLTSTKAEHGERRLGARSGDAPIEVAPPPVYSTRYGEMDLIKGGLGTQAQVAGMGYHDGRINININEVGRRLSSVVIPTLERQASGAALLTLPYITRLPSGAARDTPVPQLNIVIQIVGSRGDVQPFVSLGQVLKKEHGHRVRLATHLAFRDFVEENGLEFFSIGGDPSKLMAFMVKNPGLMPGFDALRNGDVGERRKEIAEIIAGCWRSCFEAGDGAGAPISDLDIDANRLACEAKPFVADVIIANPPSFAHIHCAEKLGIPLHLMFTMPWSPTQAFPHPLANIQVTNTEAGVANFVSYALVEMMIWQGLGDIINRFRENTLGLEPVSIMSAPGMIPRLQIPQTYCWSPALIPKPKDWGDHIDIAGFFFLPLAPNYMPPHDLTAFLAAGPPPVYIGFGSIVVDDPNGMTKLIFEAIKKTGQRALVSKGWGGLGAEEIGVPEGVFMVGNCPHDWLFKRVSCVVHHGGAGTTAAGIALGRPTVVVPFFGDQAFWGSMVAKAGAGPMPIPYKKLTADKLATAIMAALNQTTLQMAEELGAKIGGDLGLVSGAESFHKRLHVDSIRCMLAPNRAAAWRIKRTDIRLSTFAVTTLSNEGILDLGDLKLYRPREYDTEPGPRDPITGGAAALLGILGDFAMGVADIPVEMLRALSLPSSLARRTSPKTVSRSQSPQQATIPSVNEQNSPPAEGLIISPTGETTPPGSLATSTTSDAGLENVEDDSASIGSGTKPKTRRLRPEFCRERKSPSSKITTDDVICAGMVATKLINIGLKSPMDFTMGVSKGFHNAPKLYGDDSVRELPRVTGFQSGLKAAGKEFGYGLYDGISGLVTQPLRGRKGGAFGVIKGFGKGIGGLVLKPGAGGFALAGYTLNGVYKEIQKLFGASVENYIIASRSTQGYEEWKMASPEERWDVIRRWYFLTSDRDPGHSTSPSLADSEAVTRGNSILRAGGGRDRKDSGASGIGGVTSHEINSLREAFRAARRRLSRSASRRSSDGSVSNREQAVQKPAVLLPRSNSKKDRQIKSSLRTNVAEAQAFEIAGADQQMYDDEDAKALQMAIEESLKITQPSS